MNIQETKLMLIEELEKMKEEGEITKEEFEDFKEDIHKF